VGPAADQARRVSHEALRREYREVERLFGPELSGLPAPERAEVLDAIAAATSPHQWEYLRGSRRSSVPRARAAVRRTVAAILRDAGVDA
jgi:hypothetical protein